MKFILLTNSLSIKPSAAGCALLYNGFLESVKNTQMSSFNVTLKSAFHSKQNRQVTHKNIPPNSYPGRTLIILSEQML